jgi:hypothetical protein
VTPARDVSTSASRTRARAGVAVIRVYDEANRTKQKTSPDKTLTATFLLLDVGSGWDVGSSVGSYVNFNAWCSQSKRGSEGAYLPP